MLKVRNTNKERKEAGRISEIPRSGKGLSRKLTTKQRLAFSQRDHAREKKSKYKISGLEYVWCDSRETKRLVKLGQTNAIRIHSQYERDG